MPDSRLIHRRMRFSIHFIFSRVDYGKVFLQRKPIHDCAYESARRRGSDGQYKPFSVQFFDNVQRTTH